MRDRFSRDERALVAVVGLATLVLLGSLVVVASVPGAAQSSSVTVTNVTIDTDRPTAGETFVVEARIENAESASGSFSLNQVHVETPSGRSRVARNLGSLAPGTSTTVRIHVDVEEPGSHTLDLEVRGQDPSDSVIVLNHPVPIRVQNDQEARLSMSASADDLGPSNRTDVGVTVANGFDEPITGIDLHVTSDELTLPENRRVTSRLPAGNVTTFSLPARDVRPGQHTVDATLTYTRPDGERRTVQRTLTMEVTAVSEPGRIMITETDVSRDGEQLVIRGSASNVGTTDVSGVTVTVGESETAGPAEGTSTFFVGNVPASDFSSFDVSATPRANGTVTIPLEVSYVVDGERTSRVTEVTHRVREDRGSSDESSGGGLSLITIVGALLVVGGLVFGWRRYRG